MAERAILFDRGDFSFWRLFSCAASTMPGEHIAAMKIR
jgi:hypothetical protein